MTELKDGIKKIIQSGFVFKNIDSLIDDLAQRIADSLVVDEEKVEKVLNKTWYEWYGDNEFPYEYEMTQAIASAKPIGVRT